MCPKLLKLYAVDKEEIGVCGGVYGVYGELASFFAIKYYLDIFSNYLILLFASFSYFCFY